MALTKRITPRASIKSWGFWKTNIFWIFFTSNPIIWGSKDQDLRFNLYIISKIRYKVLVETKIMCFFITQLTSWAARSGGFVESLERGQSRGRGPPAARNGSKVARVQFVSHGRGKAQRSRHQHRTNAARHSSRLGRRPTGNCEQIANDFLYTNCDTPTNI